MEKITSRNNPISVHFRKLGSSKSYREKSGEFLCEGVKLLQEAVQSGIEVIAVLTASSVSIPLSVDTRVYFTDQKLIDSISTLTNAGDTLFSCKLNALDSGEDVDGGFEMDGTHILLDGVQDPGNVGTIMRSADALGISSVILTGACADPHNPKTIRASMGAVFRQRVYSLTLPQLNELKLSGARFVGAALFDDSASIHDLSLKGKIIAIGSEGKGLSRDILDICEETVKIPISSHCESLNAAVAAGILIWEAVGREKR